MWLHISIAIWKSKREHLFLFAPTRIHIKVTISDLIDAGDFSGPPKAFVKAVNTKDLLVNAPSR